MGRLVLLARRSWLFLAFALVATPVLGQNANFGSVTLSSAMAMGTLSGTTGGSTSLPALTSRSDRNSNKCLGFGDPNPDHILTLKQPFARLTLQIISNNPDTTLVVEGPDGVVRCGDNLGSRKTASITDTDWKTGDYKIWVGTAVPGTRRDYTLTVRANTEK